MSKFLHHPDGRIHVQGAMFPLAEFMIEEPDYNIDPWMGVRYDGDKTVYFTSNNESTEYGINNYLEGFIAKRDEYSTNIEARKPVDPELTVQERIDDFAEHHPVQAISMSNMLNAIRRDMGGDDLNWDEFVGVLKGGDLPARAQPNPTPAPNPTPTP